LIAVRLIVSVAGGSSVGRGATPMLHYAGREAAASSEKGNNQNPANSTIHTTQPPAAVGHQVQLRQLIAHEELMISALVT
jgi:hypothetical protein